MFSFFKIAYRHQSALQGMHLLVTFGRGKDCNCCCYLRTHMDSSSRSYIWLNLATCCAQCHIWYICRCHYCFYKFSPIVPSFVLETMWLIILRKRKVKAASTEFQQTPAIIDKEPRSPWVRQRPRLRPWRPWQILKPKLRGWFFSPLKRQTVKYIHIIFSNIYLNGKHNSN